MSSGLHSSKSCVFIFSILSHHWPFTNSPFTKKKKKSTIVLFKLIVCLLFFFYFDRAIWEIHMQLLLSCLRNCITVLIYETAGILPRRLGVETHLLLYEYIISKREKLDITIWTFGLCYFLKPTEHHRTPWPKTDRMPVRRPTADPALCLTAHRCSIIVTTNILLALHANISTNEPWGIWSSVLYCYGHGDRTESLYPYIWDWILKI